MISSSDYLTFKPQLALVSFETSKTIVFIDEAAQVGPPWIDSITEKILKKINHSSQQEASNIKVFFYKENLGIIEEVSGIADYTFDGENILSLSLELEKSNNALNPRFHGSNDFEIHTKLDKLEYKLEALLEEISVYREKNMDLEARILSIEKDDYIKEQDFYLWKILSKDNFRGLLILLVSFIAIEFLYKDVLPINKIIRSLIGVPEIINNQNNNEEYN